MSLALLAGAYTVSSPSKDNNNSSEYALMQYIRIPRCYRRIGFPSGDSVYGPFFKTEKKKTCLMSCRRTARRGYLNGNLIFNCFLIILNGRF
jgi:hypothetical protein